MDMLNRVISKYQDMIGVYDKQPWERSIERAVSQSLNKLTRKRAKVNSALIDVDLVRGSSKIKPRHSWLSISRKALCRVLFLPLCFKWWRKCTGVPTSTLLLVLYLLQLASFYLYTTDNITPADEALSISHLLTPCIIYFILAILNTQITSSGLVSESSSSSTTASSSVPQTTNPTISLKKKASNFFFLQNKSPSFDLDCVKKFIFPGDDEEEDENDFNTAYNTPKHQNWLKISKNQKSNESKLERARYRSEGEYDDIGFVLNSERCQKEYRVFGVEVGGGVGEDDERGVGVDDVGSGVGGEEEVVDEGGKMNCNNNYNELASEDAVERNGNNKGVEVVKNKSETLEKETRNNHEEKENNSNTKHFKACTTQQKALPKIHFQVDNFPNELDRDEEEEEEEEEEEDEAYSMMSLLIPRRRILKLGLDGGKGVDTNSTTSSIHSDDDDEDDDVVAEEDVIMMRVSSSSSVLSANQRLWEETKMVSAGSRFRYNTCNSQYVNGDHNHGDRNFGVKFSSEIDLAESNKSGSKFDHRLAHSFIACRSRATRDVECKDGVKVKKANSNNSGLMDRRGLRRRNKTTTTMTSNVRIASTCVPSHNGGYLDDDDVSGGALGNDDECSFVTCAKDESELRLKATKSNSSINLNARASRCLNILGNYFTTPLPSNHKHRHSNASTSEDAYDEGINSRVNENGVGVGGGGFNGGVEEGAVKMNGVSGDGGGGVAGRRRGLRGAVKGLRASSCPSLKSIKTGGGEDAEEEEEEVDDDDDEDFQTTGNTQQQQQQQQQLDDTYPERPDQLAPPSVNRLYYAMENKVSCIIWENDEIQKVNLSVLDIGWNIIKKVDKSCLAHDYFILGVFSSLLLASMPIVFRTYHSWSRLETLNMASNSTDLSLGLQIALGRNWRQVLIILNGVAQRLCLSLILFFMLAVSERTFYQRLLYAKNFSYLTSLRRARKYRLPHFRLNKVRNIKMWLSVRSFLKRRGPQRSVEVIVSVAFLASVVIISTICIEILQDYGCFLDELSNWEMAVWGLSIGVFLLRFITLGTSINKKYRNFSVLITEQINLYLHMEQKPHKKNELMMANSVLKLAEDLLKEVESPFKVSGFSANPLLYNITKVVVLSAFSAVISELLGFKLKLYKIKIRS